MKAHTMPACQVTGKKCWSTIWQQFHPVALGTLLAVLPVTGRADDDATATAAREAVTWAAPGQWRIYPRNPVLTVGPAGSWDAGALGSMTVLKAGGIYHMCYMFFADEDRAKAKTRLATSKDGFTWTVRDNDLLVGHDGEVLKIADDLYFMYFGPDGFFDQKNCDIRLAVYKGTLKDN